MRPNCLGFGLGAGPYLLTPTRHLDACALKFGSQVGLSGSRVLWRRLGTPCSEPSASNFRRRVSDDVRSPECLGWNRVRGCSK
jgi:hypothetical protein